MDSFGEIIRKLREEKELPLRTVAAFLDIDQAILSKIERGQRNASRELVVKLAEYFEINENDLLISWLSDKLVYEVVEEDVALKALKVAEQKVSYMINPKIAKSGIINSIRTVLENDGRVAAAWLFGSVARGEAVRYIDEEILVKYNYPLHIPRSFRNFIIHVYHGIRMERIYYATQELDELENQINTIHKKEF